MHAEIESMLNRHVAPAHVIGHTFHKEGGIFMPGTSNVLECDGSAFEQTFDEYMTVCEIPPDTEFVNVVYKHDGAIASNEWDTFVRQNNQEYVLTSAWRFHTDFHALVLANRGRSSFTVARIPRAWISCGAIQIRRGLAGNETIYICPDKIEYGARYIKLLQAVVRKQKEHRRDVDTFRNILKNLNKLALLEYYEAIEALRTILSEPEIPSVIRQLNVMDGHTKALDMLIAFMDNEDLWRGIDEQIIKQEPALSPITVPEIDDRPVAKRLRPSLR